VKVGVTLPQFRSEARATIEAARRAEDLGLDGVFCFDHLWPMGRPDRPALSVGPLLGAVAASTETITIGTLVARVGLRPDDALVATLAGLDTISHHRLIAGLGTGDHLSSAENLAFGVPFEPADVRRSRLATVADRLAALGIPVWVGGGHDRTIDVARRRGLPVNLWGATMPRLLEVSTTGVPVTWGGPVLPSETDAARQLTAIAAGGAIWAVCAWPASIEALAGAAARVRDLGVDADPFRP
jgi:alkanesulfonate monooxygenase SsuD/methylene tetrahydromethanopterin reductase-like flavin-dependent oxidoreductase (luciferase family)